MLNFIKSVLIYFVSVTVIISSSIALELNDSCLTPNNEAGICTPLENCAEVFGILTKNDKTAGDLNYLRNSQCGYDQSQDAAARQVMVCCSTSSDILSRATKNEKDGLELPSPSECGAFFSEKLLGGNVTLLDEYPWMALIQYRKSKLYFGFHCGGALINSRYVLTAAHCVRNPDMPPTWEVYAVRLGEWNLEEEIDCVIDARGKQDCAPAYRDITVEKFIAHDQYIPESSEQHHDIALIRLSESVYPYTDFLRPICLPLNAAVQSNSFEGTDAFIAGWGTTETATSSPKKLKASIPIWNTQTCAKNYLTHNLHINADHQMCAGGVRGVDTCRGDSGGPLAVTGSYDKRIVYIAIGVVSYGPRPCGLSGWPGVYTRVVYYIDWIRHNLEE